MAVLQDRLKQLEDIVRQQQPATSHSNAGHAEETRTDHTADELNAEELTNWEPSDLTDDSSTSIPDLNRAISSDAADGADHSTDDIYDDEDDNINATQFLQIPVVLPPAQQAWVLLQEYLVDFNKAWPLFDQDKLIDLYTGVFAETPNLDCLRLKGVYSTLAIAYRLHAMSPLASDADNHNAKSFVEQTSYALPRILVARPSLPSAQYLSAMAVVMHGTHDSQGTRSLLAAALRMLLDLSPHSLDYEERQAARVFWIASTMDVDLAVRNGQWSSTVFSPPHSYRLPQSEDTGTLPIGEQQFPIFQHRIQLTKIQTRFLQTVASVPSLRTLPANNSERQEFSASLQTVATSLSDWRLRDPLFQRCPESYRHKLHRSDLVHLTVLEATYFNTLFRLQGALQGIGPFNGSAMLHLPRYQKLDFWDHLSEAVRLLSLFNFLTHGDFAFVWLVIDAVVSAAYVLLNSAVQQPHLSKAKEGLAATTQVLRLLGELMQKHPQRRLSAALAELGRLHQQTLVKPGLPTG